MPEHLVAALAAGLAALHHAAPVVGALGGVLTGGPAGVLGATPSPSAQGGTTPSPPAGLDFEDVSPGVAGFIATAAVVAASIVVIRSMVGRLRRIRHRAELESRQEAARGEPSPVERELGRSRTLGAPDQDEPPHAATREHLE